MRQAQDITAREDLQPVRRVPVITCVLGLMRMGSEEYTRGVML
jgi:hypothetical protein